MSKDYIEGGYIILARKIIESEIWQKPPAYLKIWIYVLHQVNFLNTKKFPRGTGFFNFRQERIPGVTLNQVYEFLRWAKTLSPRDLTTQITTQKTTRGVHLKVTNYNKYQDIENYSHQHRNQHKNQQTTNTITVKNERMEYINTHTKEKNNVCVIPKISKEDREILKNYARKSKASNITAYVHTLITNGGYLEILEQEKQKAERKKQKEICAAAEKIEEKTESPEETAKGFEVLRNTVRKIKKGKANG